MYVTFKNINIFVHTLQNSLSTIQDWYSLQEMSQFYCKIIINSYYFLGPYQSVDFGISLTSPSPKNVNVFHSKTFHVDQSRASWTKKVKQNPSFFLIPKTKPRSQKFHLGPHPSVSLVWRFRSPSWRVATLFLTDLSLAVMAVSLPHSVWPLWLLE